MGTALRLRCSILSVINLLLWECVAAWKTWRRQGNKCWWSHCWRKCFCRSMDVLMALLWALHHVHTLSIENTHWNMKKRMGWRHRGGTQLAEYKISAAETSWKTISLHKIIPRGHCSVWTWWKLQWGAPFSPDTTNPGKEPVWQEWVSGKTCTQWASHGSSPKQSKKSTQTPLKCHQV